MARRSVLAPILFASLLGCSPGRMIIGDWTSNGFDNSGSETIHFGKNGDFQLVAEMGNLGSISTTGKLTVVLHGTYVLKQGVLSMTVNDSKTSGLYPEFKSLGDSQSKRLQGTTQSLQLSWKNDYEVVLTSDQVPSKSGMPPSMVLYRKQ